MSTSILAFYSLIDVAVSMQKLEGNITRTKKRHTLMFYGFLFCLVTFYAVVKNSNLNMDVVRGQPWKVDDCF